MIISLSEFTIPAVQQRHAGSVYVFERSSDGTWIETNKIMALDTVRGDNFGEQVSLSGSTLLIGAPRVDRRINSYTVHQNTGAVYVFKKNHQGQWEQVEKLFAPDSRANDLFGDRLVLDGKTAVVSSRLDTNQNGSSAGGVYVYALDTQGHWDYQTKLLAPDGDEYDYFGESLSLESNTLMIGAPNKNSGTGVVYVYENSPFYGWRYSTRLYSPYAGYSKQFGKSISLDGDTVLIGEQLGDDGTSDPRRVPASGAAYFFQRNTSGYWYFQEQLIPQLPRSYSDFGISVKLSNNIAIVGARRDNEKGSYAGAVYVFYREFGQWSEYTKMMANDGKSYDFFGEFIALDNNQVLVGAPRNDDLGNNIGLSYFFKLPLENTYDNFLEPRIWVNSYGEHAGRWEVSKHPRLMADVNGDGLKDIVGFGYDGTWVSLSTGYRFTSPNRWVNSYGYNDRAGKWRVDKHPRLAADVNGDGLDDIIGFGNQSTFVSLSTGRGFTPPRAWVHSYGYNGSAGGWRVDRHPRMMADVNGDGLADIVGFGGSGTYVSLSRGHYFTSPQLWRSAFGYNPEGGNWRTAHHPRFMVDINNDGYDDIVGFGSGGVIVSLSTGYSFTRATYWVRGFGYSHGWREQYDVREIVDVNGDNYPDVVGFGEDGVYVSINRYSYFAEPVLWTHEFPSGVWDKEKHLRTAVDMNNDGRADIVGMGDDGVYVALSTGHDFSAAQYSSRYFGYLNDAGGWRFDRHPRVFADVNGDHQPDIVGFGTLGTYISINRLEEQR